MTQRIANMDAFWPHYLSEHRDATSRRLHFVGTTGFFACMAGSFVLNPVFFPPAFLGMVGLSYYGAKYMEKRKAAFVPMLAGIGLATAASPILVPAGVVSAYAAAWVGHFKFENNRPATFQYPVWSFLSDFRMWTHMARGQLWSGDPLEELSLEAPAAAS